MSELSATDRCVKCGLCLPHCPTFRLSGIETDSPRGRISLIQSLDSPDTSDSPGLFHYLDRCLGCRACEAMCPSKVPFGALMDSARAQLESRRRRPLHLRWLRSAGLATVTSPARLRLIGLLLNGYRRLGLQHAVGRAPGLPGAVKRMNQLLPPLHVPRGAGGPSDRPAARGTVQLFRGCVSGLIDSVTLDAAQLLLRRLGYRIEVPERQTCCGALHQHNGDPAGAARLAQRNAAAFAGGEQPIVVTASGCAMQLLEYDALYGSSGFGQRVSEILQFLLQHGHEELEFEPLPRKVAVHVPCSQRNALKRAGDAFDILAWIPQLRTLAIDARGGCCGAAGSYLLSQPEVADRLREDLLDTLAGSDVDLLVSTNIGCALHLRAGLRARGMAVEVIHPVVLLARQLKP